jgi:hypothetical protein
MTMRNRTPNPARALAALLPLLSAVSAYASVRFVPAPPPGPRAGFDAACADAASPACARAVEALSREAVRILSGAALHPNADLRPAARLAVDAADPALRAAAAAALGQPFAGEADTPILAELLDDPVPAVRAAAKRALWSSQDDRGRLLAKRAEAYGGGGGESLAEETEPARGKLGVALPANAVFLPFASDPAQGNFAYFSPDAADKVLAAVRGKGEGPFTTAQFRAWVEKQEASNEAAAEEMQIAEGELPSPEQMAKMMEMAAKMGEIMAAGQAEGKSQEQMMGELAAATGQKLPVDADFADPLDDADLFANAKVVVVPLASGLRAAVAVYTDRAVGGTGITVRRPPLE